jgi:hypothetical protein
MADNIKSPDNDIDEYLAKDKEFQNLLNNYGVSSKKQNNETKLPHTDDPLVLEILSKSNISVDINNSSPDKIIKLITEGSNNLDIKSTTISKNHILFVNKE